ncbi:hypothetical protein L1987_31726 [Smallanthus sonchifolius]|uniref:Uncharacterized protein n=1 Tax=Smallanthus sonchifolius TaxID=185202 RepID=A0ACB9I863_9ASTR|nr:hypothetical protein L1987_31726 [Smallanthus sonchifolius]
MISSWNSYWFVDHAIYDHSRPRILAMLHAAAKKSLIVCRIWAFNDGDYNALQISPGQFDERVFKGNEFKMFLTSNPLGRGGGFRKWIYPSARWSCRCELINLRLRNARNDYQKH